MKKIISLVLGIALLATSLLCGSVSVSADTPDYAVLKDGGFEAGIDFWTPLQAGRINYTDSDSHSGSRSLLAANLAARISSEAISLEAGRTYLIEFYTKGEIGTGCAIWCSLSAEANAYAPITNITDSTTDWIVRRAYYKPETDGEYYITFGVGSAGSARVLIDDVSISEVNSTVVNGDFKGGKFGWIGNGTLVAEGYDDDSSIQIQNNTQMTSQEVTLEPGNYYLEYYYKGSFVSGTGAVWAKISADEPKYASIPSVSEHFLRPSSEWVMDRYPFTIDTAGTYYINFNAGSNCTVNYLLDNFRIYENNDLVLNSGFEAHYEPWKKNSTFGWTTADYKTGGYSLRANRGGARANCEVNLEAGKEYCLEVSTKGAASFAVVVDDTADFVHQGSVMSTAWIGASEDWITSKVDFIPKQSGVHYLNIGTTGTASTMTYFDDVIIREKTETVMNGSFDSALDWWTKEGAPAAINNTARFQSQYTKIYQGVTLEPGDYTVRFSAQGTISAGRLIAALTSEAAVLSTVIGNQFAVPASENWTEYTYDVRIDTAGTYYFNLIVSGGGNMVMYVDDIAIDVCKNIVKNGNFEGLFSYWTQSSRYSFVYNESESHSPNASIKGLTKSTNAYQAIELEAGKLYSVQFFTYGTVENGMGWLSVSATKQSYAGLVNIGAYSSEIWEQHKAYFTAPATGIYYLNIGASGAFSGTLYFDDITIEEVGAYEVGYDFVNLISVLDGKSVTIGSINTAGGAFGEVTGSLTGTVMNGNQAEGTFTLNTRIAGDVNGDNQVDLTDLARLKKFLSAEQDTWEADVNLDKSQDSADMAFMRRKLLGQA